MGQQVNIYMTQQGTRLIIPATQGENLAREYNITVIGLDGQPVELAGATVIMYVLKGTNVVQIPATISGNSATVILPSGACDVPGEHQCFIQIIKPDIFDLRVDNIILRVIACNVDSAGEASSEFTALTELISQATSAIQDTEEAITNANAAAEEARTTAESTATTVATSTATNIINTQKGQPNGLASLDEAGKLVQTAGLATLDSNNQLIQRTGLATLGTDGKLEAGQVPKQYPNGIWFAENGNNEFPGLSYNGTALWLGGSALSGPRHTGATTISAGGRDTAYVAVFPEEGDGTSYPVWHKGMTFKSLWDGSWSSGTITVPGIQDYNMFRIGMEGQGTVITAYRWGSHLRGIGGYVSSAGNKLAYLFTATLSENTLTWINCVDIYINNSSTVDPLTVTTIYGIL